MSEHYCGEYNVEKYEELYSHKTCGKPAYQRDADYWVCDDCAAEIISTYGSLCPDGYCRGPEDWKDNLTTEEWEKALGRQL
jgi:hypothetical protein